MLMVSPVANAASITPVMPFTNASGATEDAWMVRGVSEALGAAVPLSGSGSATGASPGTNKKAC